MLKFGILIISVLVKVVRNTNEIIIHSIISVEPIWSILNINAHIFQVK